MTRHGNPVGRVLLARVQPAKGLSAPSPSGRPSALKTASARPCRCGSVRRARRLRWAQVCSWFYSARSHLLRRRVGTLPQRNIGVFACAGGLQNQQVPTLRTSRHRERRVTVPRPITQTDEDSSFSSAAPPPNIVLRKQCRKSAPRPKTSKQPVRLRRRPSIPRRGCCFAGGLHRQRCSRRTPYLVGHRSPAKQISSSALVGRNEVLASNVDDADRLVEYRHEIGRTDVGHKAIVPEHHGERGHVVRVATRTCPSGRVDQR